MESPCSEQCGPFLLPHANGCRKQFCHLVRPLNQVFMAVFSVSGSCKYSLASGRGQIRKNMFCKFSLLRMSMQALWWWKTEVLEQGTCGRGYHSSQGLYEQEHNSMVDHYTTWVQVCNIHMSNFHAGRLTAKNIFTIWYQM